MQKEAAISQKAPGEPQAKTKLRYAVDPRQVLIDSLASFSKARLANLLKSQDLPYNGTKEDILKVLEHCVYKELIDTSYLEAKLLEWEPWSHRHTYFLKLSKTISKDDLDLKKLIASEFLNSINKHRSFELPIKLQVDTILLDDSTVRVFMSAPASIEIREQVEDKIREYDNLKYRAYRQIYIRKIYVFEMNLHTGLGFLSIPSNQAKGNSYGKELNVVQILLSKALPSLEFSKFSIQPAIEILRTVRTVQNTGLNLVLPGLKMALRTEGKAPILNRNSPKQLKPLIKKGYLEEGIFQFNDEDKESICRTRIYKDNRLGIFRDLTEEKFREVVSMVSQYAL